MLTEDRERLQELSERKGETMAVVIRDLIRDAHKRLIRSSQRRPRPVA